MTPPKHRARITSAGIAAGVKVLRDRNLGTVDNRETIVRDILAAALPLMGPKPRPRMSWKESHEIMTRYLNGELSVELGKKLGIQPNTVMNHVKAQARHMHQQWQDAGIAARAETVRVLAGEYDTTVNKVIDIMVKYGLSTNG